MVEESPFKNIDKLPDGPWTLTADYIRPVKVNTIFELAREMNRLLNMTSFDGEGRVVLVVEKGELPESG